MKLKNLKPLIIKTKKTPNGVFLLEAIFDNINKDIQENGHKDYKCINQTDNKPKIKVKMENKKDNSYPR